MSKYDQLLARLDGVRLAPTSASSQTIHAVRAFCPAHQPPPRAAGRGRTLSVAQSAAGGVLVHCHAGCRPDEVLSALGLTVADLFPDSPRGGAGNGGPAAWAGVSGACDALDEIACRIAIARGGAPAVLSREDLQVLMDRAAAIRQAARHAMRQTRGGAA